MHIVTSYRPHDLKSGFSLLRRESLGIMLVCLYYCSLTAGCAIITVSHDVGSIAEKVYIGLIMNGVPLSSLLLIMMVITLGIGSTLFASGLSMIGSACVYVTACLSGFLIGSYYLSLYVSDCPLPELKHGLTAIAVSLWVSIMLQMSEYAIIMSRDLKSGQGSGGAEAQKKYALRQIILLLSAMIVAVAVSFIIILSRHIS